MRREVPCSRPPRRMPAGGQILASLCFLPFIILAMARASPGQMSREEFFGEAAVLTPGSSLGLPPPLEVTAFDTPNDAGGSITVEWEPAPSEQGALTAASYEIYRRAHPEEEWELAGTVSGARSGFVDGGVEDGRAYAYAVRAVGPAGAEEGGSPISAASSPAVASAQLFHRGRVNILIGVIIYAALLVGFITLARRGREFFVRRIAGLEAIDEALGRATEMGKPILYVPGLSTISDVATLASLNILGRVARRAALYESRLLVPCTDPVVAPVAQEVVREAYTEAGRPDAFSEHDVSYITYSQFGYVSAVDGMMVREQPAAIFLLGMFWAESLILAETGNSVGAIQISGTDAVAQLPFFIAACDYTLIGEELYAASAYLSREPLALGSLKGQDMAKLIIGALMLAGIVATTFGIVGFARLFSAG